MPHPLTNIDQILTTGQHEIRKSLSSTIKHRVGTKIPFHSLNQWTFKVFTLFLTEDDLVDAAIIVSDRAKIDVSKKLLDLCKRYILFR